MLKYDAVPFHGQRVWVSDGRRTSSRTDSRGKYALPSTVTMSSDSAITVPFQMAVVMHVTVRAATDLFHRRRSVAADPRDAAAVLGLADEVPEHPRPPGDVGQRVCLLLGAAALEGEAEPAFHSATDRWSAMIGSRNVSWSCRCSSPLTRPGSMPSSWRKRPVRDDHLVDVRLLDGGAGHRDLLGRVGATETPGGA